MSFKLFITAVLICQVNLLSLMAQEIHVKSEVTDVKLYVNGAMVTREAKASLSPGQNTLLIENLSPEIDPRTITVKGIGDAVILSVNHRLDYLGADHKTAEHLKLEDSLALLNKKRDQILNQISVFQEEQNLLLANKSVGGTNTGVKTEDLKSVADFFRKRMNELKEMGLQLQIKEKDLKKLIDKLNQQIGTLRNTANKPFSTVVVSVSSKVPSSANFNISYLTGGASWIPRYDIRVNDSKSPVDLEFRAMVSQNTGEKWEKVKLIVSTGDPSAGGTKPTLNPWYLNFIQYRERSRMAPSVKQEQMQAMDGEKIFSDSVRDMAAYTTATENRFSTNYEISLPYTIPSDGKEYTVSLQTTSLKSTYEYYAVPSVDRDAFLMASVTGWEELNLQPGQANIYFENAYVGETFLDPFSVKDTLLVSLGRDKRISVTRETLKDFSGNQLIGGNRTRTFTYEITSKNNRKENIILHIEDHIPVSQDKEIEVKLIESSGADINSETGIVKWRVEIPASGQIKKKLGFSIKYPKDRKVNGI
jgi:uncharacterized protein (TIGR02231 family)